MINFFYQFLNAAESAAPYRLLGDNIKPQLHLIKPRGISGCIVDMITRSFCKPEFNFGMFVGAVVVNDYVKVEVRWGIGVEMAQKLEEFLVAVAMFALSNNQTGSDIEGRKKGGCAVSDIIVGDSIDITQAHRQEWLGAVKCLNLTLFIYAQDHGLVRWVDVKPHDIANFFDKERVIGEFEMALSVRRKAESVPDAIDSGFGDSSFVGQRTATPLGAMAGLDVDGFVQEGSHLFVGNRTRFSGAEFIMETLNALFEETFFPFAYRSGGKAEFFCDEMVVFSLGSQKHNLGASDKTIRHSSRFGQCLHLLAFILVENKSNSGSSSCHVYIPPLVLREYTTWQRISKVIYGTLH